jgi:hypothetical protein
MVVSKVFLCNTEFTILFQPVVKGKIDDIKKMVFGKPSDNSRAAKKSKILQLRIT